MPYGLLRTSIIAFLAKKHSKVIIKVISAITAAIAAHLLYQDWGVLLLEFDASIAVLVLSIKTLFVVCCLLCCLYRAFVKTQQ